MAIVGVVGLSGSGKSTLIDDYTARGFQVFDDIGRDKPWHVAAETIRQAALQGDVVFSDILFCCRTPEAVDQVFRSPGHPFRGRDDFEQQVGERIEWIFFENDPDQCSKNCSHRAMQIQRDLNFENALIRALTQVYEPPEKARPVWAGDRGTDGRSVE